MYEPGNGQKLRVINSLRKTINSHRLEIKCTFSTYYIHDNSDSDKHEKKKEYWTTYGRNSLGSTAVAKLECR